MSLFSTPWRFQEIDMKVLYLPTFSDESYASDFCLVMIWIFPATSEEFWRFSEDFRTLLKCLKMFQRRMSTPETFRKRISFYDMALLGHKVIIRAFLEYLLGDWIKFRYWWCGKEQLAQICESGVRNCPWCVRSMSLVCKRETHA